MRIYGVSELAHNSSLCLVEQGRLRLAAEEERFTRVKLQGGPPTRTLAWMRREGAPALADADLVAVARLPAAQEMGCIARAYVREAAEFMDPAQPWRARAFNLAVHAGASLPYLVAAELRSSRDMARFLAGVPRDRVRWYDHHRCHAASAFFAVPWDEALVVTLDGYGSGRTTTVHHGLGTELRLLDERQWPSSVGLYYSFATRALGFKPARHEGKVTGLAAFGDPRVLAPHMDRFLRAEGGRFRCGQVYGNWPLLRRLAAGNRAADVAAAFQHRLEEVVTKYVAGFVARTGLRRVVLAGGVFANVKLNQRLRELPGVDEVYVFPNMGDGGLSCGAAWLAYVERTGRRPEPPATMYLGPAYAKDEVRAALDARGLSYKELSDPAEAVAERIRDGAVVGHFSGRMEFGPRALGNRSILYHAGDPAVNKWLNQRLRRTEFMPFAPSTMAEAAPALYAGLEGSPFAARFMTITFDCSPAMKAASPAVVHVDGTARPQVVHRGDNPRYHAILEAYQERSGVGTVVNTSFNMHEEPIVASPDDAVRAFLDSGLDVLVMEDVLVENPRPGPRPGPKV